MYRHLFLCFQFRFLLCQGFGSFLFYLGHFQSFLLFEFRFLPGQILYSLHLGGNNCLGGSFEYSLFGRDDLLEFFFSRRYFRFLLLLQLGYFGFHLLLLFFFELGLLPFHFLLVLDFEFGDEAFITHCSLALLLGQHLRKLIDQLFRFLLSFRLDFL